MVRGYSEEQIEIGWLHYCVMWFTRGNREVLEGSRKERCEKIIKEKAASMGCEIKDLDIQENFIFLGIKGTPLLSPHQIVSQLKGETSKVLRKEYPSFRKMPSLWTRSYFVSTFSEGMPNEEMDEYVAKVNRELEKQREKRRNVRTPITL